MTQTAMQLAQVVAGLNGDTRPLQALQMQQGIQPEAQPQVEQGSQEKSESRFEKSKKRASEVTTVR